MRNGQCGLKFANTGYLRIHSMYLRCPMQLTCFEGTPFRASQPILHSTHTSSLISWIIVRISSSAMASYITSYAASMVQQSMQTRIVESTKRLGGRVEYALQYSDDSPPIYLGDTPGNTRREVLITVKSPRFWSRLLSGADLVGYSRTREAHPVGWLD